MQRVNSGFSARGFCNDRTYHYYLPTSLLGLALDGKLALAQWYVLARAFPQICKMHDVPILMLSESISAATWHHEQLTCAVLMCQRTGISWPIAARHHG